MYGAYDVPVRLGPVTVALLLGALFTHSAHPGNDCAMTIHRSIHFRGTVRSVEMLGERAVSLIPVDFDMNYVVTIDVESVSADNPGIRAGHEVVFGVHSPARTFIVDPLVGRKLDLVADVILCDGKWKEIESLHPEL